MLPASLGGFLPSSSHPGPGRGDEKPGDTRPRLGAGCLFPVPRYFGCPPTSEEAAERFFPLKVRRGCIWALYTTVTNRFLARSELARRKGSSAPCPVAADDTAPGTGASTTRWDRGKQKGGRTLPGRSCLRQLPASELWEPGGRAGGRLCSENRPWFRSALKSVIFGSFFGAARELIPPPPSGMDGGGGHCLPPLRG